MKLNLGYEFILYSISNILTILFDYNYENVTRTETRNGFMFRHDQPWTIYESVNTGEELMETSEGRKSITSYIN